MWDMGYHPHLGSWILIPDIHSGAKVCRHRTETEVVFFFSDRANGNSKYCNE